MPTAADHAAMYRGNPPPLSDDRPWAQGFNDWLTFGEAASAFSARMDGYDEYCRGKRDGKSWYSRHDRRA